MVIHIQSGKNNLDCSVRETKVQSMPFKIAADCDANVSAYFQPYVKPIENSNFTASFRGYPLIGKSITLPDGYTGVVLHESISPETDKDDRKFYVIHDFSSFMHWNWDKVPSKNDPLIQALTDWIDMAEALHSPIVE